MSEKKFKGTPGPWDIHYSTTAQLPYRFIIQGQQVNEDEAEANARLIAAAPDLLEALQELLEVTKWISDNMTDRSLHELKGFGGPLEKPYQTSISAIAKALGDE